ncbi:uncharacterized protein LOC127368639 isoform X5 [Dicentrarchus labrax]|uniref:uncharacterized protein LOC127368639 isoform X5 n=1 Tax=Dicentrarchus labrax TaxID=13489 RepID=UPI0021F56CAC|nr:uncharacterized protein LOC127368639 isoform X5 [Dicentrarchus labrax]
MEVSETSQRKNQSVSDMAQKAETVSWKKFFVILAGRTNDAHLEFVAKLESIGQTEVNSPEESDYLLVFCPVASRVGTVVNEAVEKIQGGKPAILVVMHHTFNPVQVLTESRRLVDNPNVKVTVDCLFYEDKLLTSNRNDTAWCDVQKYLGVSKFSIFEVELINFMHRKRDSNHELQISVPQKKFFVILAGKTNDAHLEFVAKIESIGHTEVNSPEESDYLLVFCPVASRVGSDVSEALEKLPGGKPAILVVMHHTFNPDQVLPESRRLVDNPNVELTVDCLFYEGKLLESNRNYTAWIDVQKFLGVSKQPTLVAKFMNYIRRKFDINHELQISVPQKKFFVILVGKTNDAHLEFVAKIESIGHTEVNSPEESDYLLVFCPVASRVGTDVSEALENLPGGKPAILVVMHHTFNPDQVLAESRRLVNNPNVKLTVDCLFYEDKLLTSNRNYTAWIDVQKYLGVSKISVLVAEFINYFKMKLDSNHQLQISVSQKKFFVILAGKTDNAHLEFVAKLESIGHTEVNSPEESDYLLVFCPVASRVERDVSEALENLPGGKPAILVVMHHTFNPDQVLAESRRLVNNTNVKVTVDCLFYEGKLLTSNRNDTAWHDVQKYLGVSKVSTFQTMFNMSQKKFFVILVGKTDDAHLEFVAKLESIGHTELNNPEESDYLLVFCPVASRVERDVSEALEDLPGGKPAILVVMHHTFNADQVLAESRRLVDNPNVELTVDCLFYEGKLLTSNRNDTAWRDVQKYLGVSKESTLKTWLAKSMNYIKMSQKKFFVFLVGKTNDAHLEFVAKLESIGHTEVNSLEESDYLLVFCPAALNVGTDVSEALENLPGGKPTILVMMHHTLNPDQVIADSRRLVNVNVKLTVDCLFYKDKLLTSNRNDTAWFDVQKHLGVSKVKFFVILAGKTNDAHLEFVAKLKSIGQTEVNSPEESDYLLVFCPVASRVGRDVSEALEKLPGDKPAILVVMHHTFNPDQVLAESRRLVNNPNVKVTVDCLFYEDKLLKSNRNYTAWIDVQKYLGVSKVSILVAKFKNFLSSNVDFIHEFQILVSQKKFFVILAGKTNDAHLEFVAKIESIGHTEVNSLEESDYLLVFCPVASRVGGDVSEALEKLPGDKPAILVIMHQTFEPDKVLPESRRLVDNPNVEVTVDYLFYEGKLLKSNRNDIAWIDVQKYLGVSKVSILVAEFKNFLSSNLDFIHKFQILVSQKKFCVILAGRTNDAHLDFVAKLESIGHTEVNSPEESDYLLVFCPVASGVGTDVSDALEKLPGAKPAILVVMHHTFNPEQVVAESRRQVDNPNVELTVDCLFYEGKLLKSIQNDTAWIDVQKYLGVSKESTLGAMNNISRKRDSNHELQISVSQKKFFVILAGKTNDAHLEFVANLKSIGHTEVNSPEESDYLLVFCRVASRVGTDVSDALDKLPGGKPVILVVMHHTFSPDQVLAESRRLVDNPNVELTVDCLFYKDKLLMSNRNDTAWRDVQKYLGVSKVSTFRAIFNSKRDSNDELQISVSKKKFFVILVGKTNDAHLEFVAKLESIGQTEVNSPEESDYLLVFCPVASRVGTDVSGALENFPGDKPAILFVMHHTFNRDQVLAESRRLVDNPNVELTVDCLFYEDKLLKSNRNDTAWIDVQKYLGVSKESTLKALGAKIMNNISWKRDFNHELQISVFQKKFFVILAGKTNDAHLEFVAKLKSIGHTEVNSPEESDYLLVFCPVASRVGRAVSDALEKLPGDKPAILVVMHHTFNPDHVVVESRRLVDNPNVQLTVDCLFYEGKLLKSNRNDIAWFDVKKYLGVSMVSTLRASFNRMSSRQWLFVFLVILFLLVLLVAVILSAVFNVGRNTTNYNKTANGLEGIICNNYSCGG